MCTEKNLIPDEKCVEYIQYNLSQTSVLVQLAEECNEVAQQALKLVRIFKGENPTPVTAPEAMTKLHEEIADFFACLDCLADIDYNIISKTETEKLNRWCIRLAKHNVK